MLTGDVPRGMFKLPSEKVPGLDARFDAIICKALEEDREERYQSVAELATEVASLPKRELKRENEGGRESARRNAGAFRYAFAAAAVVILAVGWLKFPKRGARLAEPPDGWQDVLSQIDVTQHRRAGHWKLVDGKLGNGDDASGSVIEFPVKAPGASDLRIRLTRQTAGSGAVTIGFHIGDRGGQFIISDYSRPRVGLEFIDGKALTTIAGRVTGHA